MSSPVTDSVATLTVSLSALGGVTIASVPDTGSCGYS